MTELSIHRGWQALADFIDDAQGQERFWSKVEKRGPDECWTWTGSRAKSGYGQMTYGGGLRRASRLAWALANGRSPNDLFVCPTCDNPPCVNPSHLFSGTSRDNVRDMVAKGRHVRPDRDEASVGRRRGEESHLSKLKLADVLVILQRRAQGHSIPAIAADYGIHRNTVGRISRGKTWATARKIAMKGAAT